MALLVGEQRWGMVWRFTFRLLDGTEEVIDCWGSGILHPIFVDAAHDEMRRRHGSSGWWLHSWQNLRIVAGRYEWIDGKVQGIVNPPPIRRRVVLALRRWRRGR